MAKDFKRYLITSALPYANGPVHIGHLAGVYIPSDIYTRYLRLRGRDVISVCGSDEHGVPITIKAKKEGITPQQVVDRYHNIIKDSFEKLGISFDIYSRTTSPTHAKTASDFFRKLYDEGKFVEQTTEQFYDEEGKITWADEFLDMALESAKNNYALYNAAKAAGHTLTEEEQESTKELFSQLKTAAKSYGYNTSGGYLKALYGKGASLSSYKAYYEVTALASSYYQAYTKQLSDATDNDALRDYEADKM